MKIICNRSILLAAVSLAADIAGKGSHDKPAQRAILFSASDGSLLIEANNLEQAIGQVVHEVSVDRDGQALIPADKLKDILKSSEDDTLTIEATKTTVTITGADADYELNASDPKEYLPADRLDGAESIEVSAGVLSRLIARTIFAVPTNSTIHTAVNIAFDGGTAEAAGTDGRRLAVATGGSPDDGSFSTMIPVRAAAMIHKLLDDADPDDTVSIRQSDGHIGVSFNGSKFTSLKVEGDFPPYQDVIPQESSYRMDVSAAAFLSALERVAILLSDESNIAKFAFEKNELVLTASSAEAGRAKVKLPCRFTGGDFTIALNPYLLADALKVVGGVDVSLEFTAPNRPALLRSGSDYKYVVMPAALE